MKVYLILILTAAALLLPGRSVYAEDPQPEEDTAGNTAEESTTVSADPEDGVRIKDLARIYGVRSNQLVGYGVVVGLPGTGDSRTTLASDSIKGLIGNLGHSLKEDQLRARNIAAVIVTAEMPAYARKGDRLNVTVASIGDAQSLEGGVLIQTPLQAGGKSYALAQGVITTGGRIQGNTKRDTKTVGNVLSGALVEQDLEESLLKSEQIRIQLRYFDFTTLSAMQKLIREKFPETKARIDGGSVLIDVGHRQPVELIAEIENLRLVPDYKARVIINERTGTIVMGGQIQVDPVAVSRGGIQLQVAPQIEEAYQGIYVRSEKDEKPPVTREFSATTISEIVEALNAMGANVQDIIAILEALRDSGALHAEVVVM